MDCWKIIKTIDDKIIIHYYAKYMEVIILTHARQRMELRGISEEMIRDALLQPETQGKGYLSRILSYKKFGNKYLKVVSVVENQTYWVITVIWKSKI